MSFRAFVIVASAVVLSSCASPEANRSESSPHRMVASSPTLVGAWEVTASRAKGVGKNLLTFSSDGTFFRSGDTHPVVSGGHGAWKLVGTNQYNASYVSFSFDQSGKWVGINRNNLQLTLGPDGNEFTGAVKSSNRDLQDNVISTGSSPLAGQRIQVQPF
jgi:hypothetical protein